jgi:predicted phosphodiesterase
MVYTRRMLACLYDIHGNLPALEAVLADAEARGASRWILGGDYALFGGWPRETVERLRRLDNAIWIRGNGERWTRDVDDAPDNPVVRSAIASVRAALGDDLVAGMADIELLAQDRDALICHASPPSDVRSFFPEPADDEAELLAGVTDRRLVFGHTHLQFQRPAVRDGIELLNPGSIGIPLDGDHRAAYALIAPDGTVERRRVEYDWRASAQALRDRYGDAEWVGIVTGRIERARLEPS